MDMCEKRQYFPNHINHSVRVYFVSKHKGSYRTCVSSIFKQQQCFLESGRTGSSTCLKDETEEMLYKAHVPYWEGTWHGKDHFETDCVIINCNLLQIAQFLST